MDKINTQVQNTEANKQGMTIEQELAALRAENEALKKSKVRGLSFKVGKAGGLSVYGLGRFPVTLYRSQWENLLHNDNVTAIHAFIQAHADELKTKDQEAKGEAQDQVNESA